MSDLPRQARSAANELVRRSEFSWRRATARSRALPNFVIIGAYRTGTTSLYRWVVSHPEVDPAFTKEVHYFDIDYGRGLDWYRAHFGYARPGRLNIESSPYMLFHPLAPERAARDLPRTTRFIALLREPVERAVSHYFHACKSGFETESFEQAIELEPQRLAGAEDAVRRGELSQAYRQLSYVKRGEYAGQLVRWFEAVGRDRVLVLESEQVFSDPETLSGVSDWLGLSKVDVPYESHNAARRPSQIAPDLLDRLARHYEPFNEELFALLGRRLWTNEA